MSYMTVPQAAEYLNTSERFVRRLIAERRVAFHHVGRHDTGGPRRVRPGRPRRTGDTPQRPAGSGASGVMANKKRRRFGAIRQLSSGRFQARYRGPDGLMRAAPQVFLTERDADRWLTMTEAEILRGEWIDPWKSATPLSEFGPQWIKEGKLRPRTTDDYESILPTTSRRTSGTRPWARSAPARSGSVIRPA